MEYTVNAFYAFFGYNSQAKPVPQEGLAKNYEFSQDGGVLSDFE